MRGDLVIIDWIDHSGGVGGWTDVEEMTDVSQAYTIKTAGFVVAENRQRIRLVQNWAINDMANHQMTIEKKLIRSIKVLKKGK